MNQQELVRKAYNSIISGIKPSGTYEAGNIDILNRPKVVNPDGSISTVKSVSFSDDSGMTTVVPSVIGNKVVSPKEAWSNYQKTGQHLGRFASIDEANRYAQALHNQQAKYYGVK